MPTYNILKNIEWIGLFEDGLSVRPSIAKICVYLLGVGSIVSLV